MKVLGGMGGVFGLYVYFTSSLILAFLFLSLSLSVGKRGEAFLGKNLRRISCLDLFFLKKFLCDRGA